MKITEFKDQFRARKSHTDKPDLRGVDELDADQCAELLAYIERLYGAIDWWSDDQRLRFLTVIRQLQARLLEVRHDAG